MLDIGFVSSKFYICLYFTNFSSKFPLFVLLYVDDILLMSSDSSLISFVKSKLLLHFDMKDMSEAKKILGNQIIS